MSLSTSLIVEKKELKDDIIKALNTATLANLCDVLEMLKK